MSEPAPTSATSSTPSANTGVKKGLPNIGLPYAEATASSLWAIARFGMTSNEAYARQLGRTKASGNTWATLIALLRGFKLIVMKDEKIGLSPLGQRLVNYSDPEGQLEARRTALLNLKAYADLVQSFDGTELPEPAVLATRLQFEYGKTPEFAQKAAQAFIESLRHAKMIDSANMVRKGGDMVTADSIEESDDVNGEPDEDAEATELDRAFEAEDRSAQQSLTQELATGTPVVGSTMTNRVSISVTLDLSNFRAEEVVQILQALKGI